MPVRDARFRTKDYLDAYLNTLELARCNSPTCGFTWIKSESPSECPECESEDITAFYNLTKDDNTTALTFMVAYSKPKYNIYRVFIDNAIDLIYSISEPTSSPLRESNLTTWGYKERVPITLFCIDKPGITATKCKTKAEQELRLVCQEYPYGSVRLLDERVDNDTDLGGYILYSTTWFLGYKRRIGW